MFSLISYRGFIKIVKKFQIIYKANVLEKLRLEHF